VAVSERQGQSVQIELVPPELYVGVLAVPEPRGRLKVHFACSPGVGSQGVLLRCAAVALGLSLPFMDSVMDALKSYDLGCALTTAEFVAFVAIGNMFADDEPGRLSASVRVVWTYIAVACMVGKLILGFLIVRPFKRTVGFGFGSSGTPEEQNPNAGDGDIRDVEFGRSARGSDLGMSRGENYRVSGGSGRTAVVRELAGPERRPGSRMYDDLSSVMG